MGSQEEARPQTIFPALMTHDSRYKYNSILDSLLGILLLLVADRSVPKIS